MSNQVNMKPGWYLLKTKPRDEQRAVDNLENQGFEAYSPRALLEDREQILFPGYAFLKLTEDNTHAYHKIRSTRGVTELVHFKRINRQMYERGQRKAHNSKQYASDVLPSPIPNGNKIMAAIESIIWDLSGDNIEDDTSSVNSSPFQEGDFVCYKHALFKHLQTTFVRCMNDQRGLILISFIESQRTSSGITERVVAQQTLKVPLSDLEKV